MSNRGEITMIHDHHPTDVTVDVVRFREVKTTFKWKILITSAQAKLINEWNKKKLGHGCNTTLLDPQNLHIIEHCLKMFVIGLGNCSLCYHIH